MPSEISPAASAGFSNATAYEAHRPSYPHASVSCLLNGLNLTSRPGAKIVEIAAGTGKFTELLAARTEKEYEICAVEPLESMRKVLEVKELRGVKVLDGVAADLKGVEGGWGDGCVAAQAFHWFANEEALKEIHRVLKPGASFGMIWNIENYNKPASWPASTPWEQNLNELIHTLEPDGQPRFREDRWRDVFLFPGQNLFATPLGEETIHWTVSIGEDALWQRISTLSQVSVLTGKKREEFEGRFWETLREEGGGVVRNERGEMEMHGVTFCAWTKRL